MKKIYALLLFCCFRLLVFSQNVNHQFSVGFASSGDDRARSVAIDQSGNSYLTGSFSNQINIGGVVYQSSGGSDIFIVKLDVLGNVVWSKTIGGIGNDAGRDIVLDNLGNVIVVGFFNGTVDFDPGVGVNSITSFGLGDGFVLKMNSSGVFNYAGNVGGVDEDRIETVAYNAVLDDIALGGWLKGEADISPNPESDINLGTYLANSNGGSDFFVTMLDNEQVYEFPSFFWGFSRGGTSDDLLWDMTFDNDGYLIMSGSFIGDVNFGLGSPIVYGGGFSGFLAKYDWDGDAAWVKNVILSGEALGVHVRDDNSIVCIGNFFNGIFEYSFQNMWGIELGGQYINLPSVSNDSFVATFDQEGQFLNFKTYTCDQTDVFYALTSDSQGNVYVGGLFSGSMDVDGTVLTSQGLWDVIVLKLDPSLEKIWAKSTGGALSDDYVWDMQLFPNDDIGLVSNFQSGTIDLDPNISNVDLPNQGSYDGVYTKWCNISTPVVTPDGPTIFCQNQQVGLSTTGFTSYLWSNGLTQSQINVSNSGNYSVIATNATGCKQSSNVINVVVNPLPNVTCTMNLSNPVCTGTEIILTAFGATTYEWSGGVTNTSPFEVSSSENFTVLGTDANGCQNSAQIAVTAIPSPSVSITVNGSVMTADTDPNCTFQWYNCVTGIIVGETNANLAAEADQLYYVEVTNNQGCSSQSDCTSLSTSVSENFGAMNAYPNPFNDRIYLGSLIDSNNEYLIYDINGKVVLKGNTSANYIDVSGLSQGSYILSIPALNIRKNMMKI